MIPQLSSRVTSELSADTVSADVNGEDTNERDINVETAGNTEPSDEPTHSKSRLVTFLQGATVFILMFATLWWLLSRNDQRTA